MHKTQAMTDMYLQRVKSKHNYSLNGKNVSTRWTQMWDQEKPKHVIHKKAKRKSRAVCMVFLLFFVSEASKCCTCLCIVSFVGSFVIVWMSWFQCTQFKITGFICILYKVITWSHWMINRTFFRKFFRTKSIMPMICTERKCD